MELPVSTLRELLGVNVQSNDHSFVTGKCYIIRTVTMFYIGRVRSITASDIVLEDACWVADTGRWNETLVKGGSNLNEVEPFPDYVIVARGAMVDAAPWNHDLPSEVK